MAFNGIFDEAAAIYAVATGEAREELEGLRRELSARLKELNALQAGINALPQGEKRDTAWNKWVTAHLAWKEANRQFNEAAINHNKVSAVIKSVTFGAYSPGTVSTSMAALPLLPVAAIMLAAGAALYAMAALIDSIKSKNTEVKGYIAQVADVLHEGGVIIEKSTTLLWSIAIIGGVVALIMWWRSLPKRSKPVAAAPAELALKPVEGAVL